MKKSRVWQAIVPGTQGGPRDTLKIRKTPWHGVTKQPPAVPVPGPKGLAGNCSRHTKQATRHPSNQENAWHGVTKQPPAVPLPGPNVTPEPNEKIKGLAGNCSRHTKQATRHPSNQENTLARRDETASCRPCARAKRHSCRMKKSRVWPALPLFQAQKPSHKTPFKSGKHPGTA